MTPANMALRSFGMPCSAGFSLQATILMKMFNLVETGQVRVPLGDAANNPGVSNQMFLRDHVMNLLVNAFPNVSKYVSLLLLQGAVLREVRYARYSSFVRSFARLHARTQGARAYVRGRSV
jgi:hypothetical protein